MNVFERPYKEPSAITPADVKQTIKDLERAPLHDVFLKVNVISMLKELLAVQKELGK